jgi:hypothetical protein
MRTDCALSGSTKACSFGLFAALLSCAAFVGCENFCVVAVSNPGGGGGVVGAGTTCPTAQQTGNVTLQLGSSFTPVASSWPSGVQHIFVTLRGIEALPINPSGDDSPAWQELAPDLVMQPAQVDLMAQPADACGPRAFPDAVIDAGVYDRIRLRLVPNQTEASEPVPVENACGKIGFNCIVATNGTLQVLASSNPAELQVPAESIAGGFFRVLPGDHIRLAIEFEPRASFILPAGDAAQIVPSFFVTQRSACESGS